MQRLLLVICGTLIITALSLGFIAYFVQTFDADLKIYKDGFGRALSDTPWFMRVFMGQERMWPGWFWFFADMVIFWGMLFTAVQIGKRATEI